MIKKGRLPEVFSHNAAGQLGRIGVGRRVYHTILDRKERHTANISAELAELTASAM